MKPHAKEKFLSENMEVEEPTNSKIDEEEQPGSNLDDDTTENTINEDMELSFYNILLWMLASKVVTLVERCNKRKLLKLMKSLKIHADEITTQLNLMILPLKWMAIIHYQILNILQV